MLGYIYLIDNKTNKIIKSYKEDEFNKDSNFIKNEIKDKYLDKYNNRFKLTCSCNKSIELSIDSIGRIYHKNKSDLIKHNKYCQRHKNYKENYSKGWNESYDKITANLNFNVLPNKENTIKQNKNGISLSEFTKHLNILACQNDIKDKYDIINRIYFLSENIHIKGFKKQTLKDFYFNSSKFKYINENSAKFVYMYVIEAKEFKDNLIKIKCEYNKDRYFDFIVDKALFQKEYYSKFINNENTIVVSGFVNKSKEGIEFYNFSLIKVNKKGIF